MHKRIRLAVFGAVALALWLTALCGCSKSHGDDPGTPSDSADPPASAENDAQAPAAENAALLFDEGYCAILPAGGTVYKVVDAHGICLRTFKSTFDEWGVSFTGLYKADDSTLTGAARPRFIGEAEGEVLTAQTDYGWFTVTEADGTLRKYDLTGTLVYEVAPDRAPHYAAEDEAWIRKHWVQDGAILSFGECDLAFSGNPFWDERGAAVSARLVDAKTGETVTALPYSDSCCYIGVVGDRYLIRQDTSDGPYLLCDTKGEIVAANIVPAFSEKYFLSIESGLISMRCEYYALDGTLYNTSGSAIGKVQYNSQWPQTSLQAKDGVIEGLSYDVEGIACDRFIYLSGERTAVWGRDGRRIAVYDGLENFVIGAPFDNASLIDFNDDFIEICQTELNSYGYENGIENTYTVVDQLSGKVILSGADNYALGSGYVLESDYNAQKYSVYDRSGTETYTIDGMDESKYISVTGGGCIVMLRGSYVGIADIYGNWILKALRPMVAEDTKVVFYH